MIDIIVSFDTTGSMYPCLSEVRTKIKELLDTIFDGIPDLRVGIIAHGDYCDGVNTIHLSTLTTCKERLQKFITEVKHTSGGDADECYELVLSIANEHFKAVDRGAKKILILIGDADPHPATYRYQGLQIKDWRKELDALLATDAVVYPIQCLSIHAKLFYKTLADKSGTPHLFLHQFTNIYQTLLAIGYSQVSSDRVIEYGKELESNLQLNRNLADIINKLANTDTLVGGVSYAEVPKELEAVDPSRFQLLTVDKECSIRDFVTSSGAVFKVGKGFYELTKTETIQECKKVILQNKYGDFFTGDKARELLGFPRGTRGKITPSIIKEVRKEYKVFFQSTSYNRKLIRGTLFLYEVD